MVFLAFATCARGGIHKLGPALNPHVTSALSLALISTAPQFSEAPTGFDNKTDGMIDDSTHQADQVKFEEIEQLGDGLGPLYNAQSCREDGVEVVTGRSLVNDRAICPNATFPDKKIQERIPKNETRHISPLSESFGR